MNKQMPLTLKKMLLLAFVLAGLLPALLVSLLSFYQARLALRNEIAHELQTTGETVASHVERVLFERVQNVHSWSQLAIMQDLLIGDIDKRLSVFLDETRQSYGKQYLSLDVINLHGEVVASSQPASIGKSQPLPVSWYQFQVNGQTLQMFPLQGNVIKIAAPILSDTTMQPIGQLIASFNWSVIQDLLNHSAQNSTELALLDSQGHVLAHSIHWSNQTPSLHARAPLQSVHPWASWVIYLDKDHDVAVAPVHRLGGIFIFLLALIIMSAMLLVRPIAHSISQPLEALTRYVQQLRKNNLEAPQLAGPAEVQALQRTFINMRAELIAYEQQLTQAAKLAVVGEMAAAMSHEVRTPLGIMRSSAEVLLREPALTADGKEVLGFIISETERLNKLVTGLIDAARPRLPNKIPLVLDAHIAHVMAMLTAQAEAKKIALHLHVTESVTIAADPDQITQVLLNLVMNAIQMLAPGGQIAISLWSSAEHAMLTVADNGPGVALAQQTQLFDTFFTQRAGGIGLGLAVVKQIIEAHGGKITYCASPWQGAQFNIQLPAQHP